MQGNTPLLFLARWVRAPLRTGAIAPSGRQLANVVVSQIPAGDHGIVVELGGGTGSVTEVILESGISPDRLVVIEKDPAFHRHLTRRFPNVRVLQGDAAHLHTLLAEAGETRQVRAVISGLPLLPMPAEVRQAIMSSAFTCLGTEGRYIQFTYGPRCPVPEDCLSTLGLDARPVGRAWRNIPPATVWQFTKPAEDARRAATA